MKYAVNEYALTQLVIGTVTGVGWSIPNSITQIAINLGGIILDGVGDKRRHWIDEHRGDAPVANLFFTAVTPMFFIRYFVRYAHVEAHFFARRNAEIAKPFFSLFGQEDRAIRIAGLGIPWRWLSRDGPCVGDVRDFFSPRSDRRKTMLQSCRNLLVRPREGAGSNWTLSFSF